MNIFILDKSPKKSAIHQIDKHVVKMPLETAQLLCTSLIINGSESTPYRSTHRKHPCTVWTSDNRTNFKWLVTHGIALCEEYTRRYGRRHKSQDVIEWCSQRARMLPAGELTPHAQAMPPQYRSNDAVEAYRAYYQGEKKSIATWKQNKPLWWCP